MTVITHARRKSKLAKMIDAPGGVSVGVALSRARANLETLRQKGLEQIEERIGELAAIEAPADAGESTEPLAVAYRTANGIIDAAAPFELRDVCAIALGLCELVDAATPDRPFDWRVLPVYVQSLRLLLALPADATAERAKVRASLEKMVDRKLAQTG